MIEIATWNVNSIKARIANVCRWLAEAGPDIVLLQETKVVDDAFPALELGDLGYNCAVAGQKTYNGVAVLSKQPIDVLERGLPGDESDQQARYLEVFTAGLRVASVYAPNGNPVGTEKFTYKLSWLDRLCRHVAGIVDSEDTFVLGGDLNIAPTAEDVYDPAGWQNDALCHPEARAAYRRLCYLGLTDAVRAVHPSGPQYTWWDYRGGAWAANHGLRIDFLLLSPAAADRLAGASVAVTPRQWDKASDHAPVCCRLMDAAGPDPR